MRKYHECIICGRIIYAKRQLCRNCYSLQVRSYRKLGIKPIKPIVLNFYFYKKVWAFWSVMEDEANNDCYRNEHIKNLSTCDIIKTHHESMKEDPEHLTTEFIKKLINADCEDV